jgi:predicted RecA/RadA family phage recombinase
MTITGIQLRCAPEHTAAMTVTLGGTITAGYLSKIGDTVGVYFNGGDALDIDSFIYRAKKIVLAKDAGSALTIAQGGKVYYNSSTHKVCGTSGDLCGRAIKAAAGLDTTVEVDFNGAVAA